MVINIYLSRCLFITLSITCLFCGKTVHAQESGEKHVIRLTNETLTTTANAGAFLDNLKASQTSEEPVQVLIHFTELPTNAQRALLQQNGVTLLEYIPDNTYSALLVKSLNKEEVLSCPVYAIVNTKPEWKAGTYLWNSVRNKKTAVEVLVSFVPGVDPQKIREVITGLGGKINPGGMEKYGSYKVIIAANNVRTLADWYGVRNISPVTDIVPLDLESRPSMKGNVATSPAMYGGYGLTGDSVTVGVGDNASGIYHADLNDRITNFNPAPISKHGEHVNGIVGGAGNVDAFGVGMATHVSLLDFLYDLILPDEGIMYQDHNMTITNNSYEVIAGNCDYAGTYDGYSQFLDTLALQLPYMSNVFASGNDGLGNCTPFPAGFATVGGGYQPAKNNIVVGSMTDHYIEANDESRGPVRDGRLKPEIIAIGLVAYSTVLVDDYEWDAGTSMASPQVAGGMALLTQRYKQVNGGVQPRADLLKAILLNGTMDLGNPGPDYSFGYGAMDIYRSLQMIDSSNFTANDISNGDSQSFTINVPPGTGQLKVMLCWNDRPASASASKQLVNDLDLTVKDPSSIWHLPLGLDPTPANVNNNATEKPDHLNNTEQVTINNPTPGTFTIKTKGYSIPFGPQHYAVAYDIIPKALHLTYPLGGEQLFNGTSPFDSIRVFWDAVSDGNTFTIELSKDNGGSWITLSNNIGPDVRHLSWFPTGFSTSKVLIRLSRNGTSEVATSQRFTINDRPVVALDTAQCPGYINIHWSPVLNASGYYLLSKVGKYMQVVDSVTDTAYSFSGMSLTNKSYVAVQPIIEGMPGCRSIATITIANGGNCTKTISAGDLMVEKLVSSNAGRMYTNSAFTGGSAVTVRLRDLYNLPCTNYTLNYKVNAGAWQTLTSPVIIPANGTADVNLTGLSITATGVYNITVAVHNLDATDPHSNNDTLAFVIKTLPNDTLNLSSPFLEGFETMGITEVNSDSMGVSPNAHWDFFHTDNSGRMRSFVSAGVTISGNRSISLDQNQNKTPAGKNTFVGTFNLANYDTSNTEVRLDFDYYLHGWPASTDGNLVSVRGVDTAAWKGLYTYDLSVYPGTITPVKSLSLTDACRLSHKNFSSSFQLSFGQSDTSLIATVNYGNGMTFDNVKMYTVANDAALAGVVSPLPANCGLSSPQPFTVQVHNGVNYTLYNVQMFYNEDGGPTYSGTIDSIRAKATTNFTFAHQVDVSTASTHNINVWLSEAGDNYKGNDSILNYHFRNSQIISAFPYLENFEQGDGGYFSDGFKNSWQFGTPASQLINKAASGVRAWKTNLTGHYNNLERSFLYSPCFDISQLANPMLSFSMASDIENCGNTLCDAAFVEISFDGQTWSKLGSAGQGTNWYDPTFDIWNQEGFTRWHVASIPLPQPGPGQTTHFRFVLNADPGVTFEGLAIDDIHVFDRANAICPSDVTAVAGQDVSGNQWVNYLQANQLLASVEPQNQSIANLGVSLYHHDTLSNPDATQYTFSRSYLLGAPQAPADSIGVRLFLTESDLLKVLGDTTCFSCTPVADAYSLGVTQFSNVNTKRLENSTLADDTGGVFIYHPYKTVKWVPCDNGYYAEFKAKPLSECWFNNGGPTGTFPAGIGYLDFIACRNGSAVTISWHSLIDTAVNIYTPQWSVDGIHFADVKAVPANHTPVANYSVNDPVNFPKYPIFFYRLQWTMTGSDQLYYSPVRRVDFGDSATTQITFDAKMVNHQDVLLDWTSYLDGFVGSYKLERSNGSSPYFSIGNVPSFHKYGQAYSFIDQPGGSLPKGTLIHYRLTAVMEDGTTLVLPERTIEWVDGNSIVDLFPNPSHDGSFTIGWKADAGTPMYISITDAAGRSVFETTVVAAQWSNSTTIHTLSNPKGVYFVRMIIDGRKYVRKVVFQ